MIAALDALALVSVAIWDATQRRMRRALSVAEVAPATTRGVTA
jgi:hypothetical protein